MTPSPMRMHHVPALPMLVRPASAHREPENVHYNVMCSGWQPTPT